MPLALPGWFLRLTGVIEVLGAIGLIVPWLTGIRPGSDTLGSCRAGDHHDRSRDLHNLRWRYCHGADAARCGAFMRFRRLRPLASDAVSRIGSAVAASAKRKAHLDSASRTPRKISGAEDQNREIEIRFSTRTFHLMIIFFIMAEPICD